MFMRQKHQFMVRKSKFNPWKCAFWTENSLDTIRISEIYMSCISSICPCYDVKHGHIGGWIMMTSSNGNISALLVLCVGNSPVTGEFPSQRPVTRIFDVLFGLHLNKRLSKQSRRRWFETPSDSLWRHCNDNTTYTCISYNMRSSCLLFCNAHIIILSGLMSSF